MGHWRIESGSLWQEQDFAANREIVMELVEEPDCVIHLREDDLILPGMIDMHAHIWAPPARSPFGVEGNRYFSEGFVGALDAGTFGVNDWEQAQKYWQTFSNLRLKSFLSILPEGLTVFPPVTPTLPEEIDTDRYVDVISAHPGQALGVKVQLGWLPYRSAETDTALMRLCREIAHRSKTHMMVHTSGQCMDARDSANFLQRGDILTHPYSGFSNTILDEHGNVLPEVFAARERGVLFDVGYAGKHFSWRVFREAYAQGLKFDTLGADLVEMSYRTPGSKVVDQFHILSALLNFGISREEVFQALMTNPARYLEFPLTYRNQCVVLRRQERNFEMIDGQGESYSCSFLYTPILVIQNGQLLKNQTQCK
ncbi:hypothetical protein [Dysosmobacter sp. Phy]